MITISAEDVREDFSSRFEMTHDFNSELHSASLSYQQLSCRSRRQFSQTDGKSKALLCVNVTETFAHEVAHKSMKK